MKTLVTIIDDTILGGGAMPLAILERRVDTWVAQQNISDKL